MQIFSKDEVLILTDNRAPCELQLTPDGKLLFGTNFTPNSFRANWVAKEGWFNPRIVPGKEITLPLEASVLHYAGEIFEGLKAFSGEDGSAFLFRIAMNIERFNRSAERMCLPTIPEKLMRDGIEQLVDFNRASIPSGDGNSMYIRPAMIDISPAIGLREGTQFLFYVLLSPSGPYFKDGIKPISLLVTDEYARAAPHGTGLAKTGGNYAASMLATRTAKAKGCDQVLFLDCSTSRYVEECTAMNVFFVHNGVLRTPPVDNGKILKGITRDSVLRIAGHLMGSIGLEGVDEGPIAIDELIEGIRSGEVTEAATCGTAAVVTPVGRLLYHDQDYIVGGGKIGPITLALYQALTGMQYGKRPDIEAVFPDWRTEVPKRFDYGARHVRDKSVIEISPSHVI